VLVSDIPTPEELYLKKEDLREKKLELIQLMKAMAPTERLVFQEIMNGKSYREASENIGCNSKAIDNALRRIKKKVLKRISCL
jgi:DNA-directed RNA polymerase specialized sigma24 family protein